MSEKAYVDIAKQLSDGYDCLHGHRAQCDGRWDEVEHT